MLEVITSTANPRIKAIRGLHRAKERRARSETLIEGPVVFADFLAEGFAPKTVLCTPDDVATIDACHGSNIPFTLVTENVLSVASDTRTPQSPVAVIRTPDPVGLREHDTLVLVDVADPGNVGTMIRTATALGWDVAATGSTADLWSPKVIRAGAGAHSRARLTVLDDPVTSLHEHTLTIVATVVDGGKAPGNSPTPVALLVGSEAHGLSAEMITGSDVQITIPMPGGSESLNAAVAAGIAMYAMTDVAGFLEP